MKYPHPITIPQVNPNETDAILVDLFIEEGKWVEAGEIIGVLETTKSTQELIADIPGFVAGLHFSEKDLVTTGDVLCTLVQTNEEVESYSATITPLQENQASSEQKQNYEAGYADLRISGPALELAKVNQLDPDLLPRDRFITQDVVLSVLARDREDDLESNQGETSWESNAIVLYGGGGHAKMLIDLIQGAGIYAIEGIIDDSLDVDSEILGIPVLGGSKKLVEIKRSGIQKAVNAVGGIGNIRSRIGVFETLISAGFDLPPVVHPAAIIEPSASLSPGAQIFAKAYIGGDVHIGFGAIVSTGSIISHDCVLGKYSIISPGAILAGEVRIGSRVLVGMGVTINLRVEIGENTRIGNSTTILSSVPSNQIIQAGSVYR